MPDPSVTHLRETADAAGVTGNWMAPGEPIIGSHVDGATRGAYAYFVRIGTQIIANAGRMEATLHPGWYLYLGSARGPGGLPARINRHFRSAQKGHWHIDQLSAAAIQRLALAVPGDSECRLVRKFIASRHYEVAVPGFGSTDCRTCPSHLLILTA